MIHTIVRLLERAGWAGFFAIISLLAVGGWLLGTWFDRGLFRKKRRVRNRHKTHA